MKLNKLLGDKVSFEKLDKLIIRWEDVSFGLFQSDIYFNVMYHYYDLHFYRDLF